MNPKQKRPELQIRVTGRPLNSPPPKSAHNHSTFRSMPREWLLRAMSQYKRNSQRRKSRKKRERPILRVTGRSVEQPLPRNCSIPI